MKTALRTFLGAFGLAPASQIERLQADVHRSGTKLAQLERDLELVRADAQSWKRRHEDAADAMTGWKQAVQRAQAATEQAQAEVTRLKTDLERANGDLAREKPKTDAWRQRAETLKAELQDIRARGEHAQRAADLANEQLMAMQVKLDLIEAAIQVLDLRTREQVVARVR